MSFLSTIFCSICGALLFVSILLFSEPPAKMQLKKKETLQNISFPKISFSAITEQLVATLLSLQ